MFNPSGLRLMSVGVYLHVSWMYLSLAVIFTGAGVLAGLERRVEALPLLVVGPMFLYVGMMALDRLRMSLGGSGRAV